MGRKIERGLIAVAVLFVGAIAVYGIVTNTAGQFRTSQYVVLGCLVSAVFSVGLAERTGSKSGKMTRRSKILVCIAILSCYGACVGIAASVLSYVFEIRQWISLVAAIPLGVLLLIFLARSSET
jgi:hypothetical protein